MISTPELWWLAGILEGEGCFGPAKHTVRIQLAMCDRDVVEKVARLLGVRVTTSVDKRPGNQIQYRAYIQGHRAAAWLMTLYTMMGARRKARIRESLLWWLTLRVYNGLRTHCPKGHPLSGPNLYRWERQRACRTCSIARTAEWNRRTGYGGPGYVERRKMLARVRYHKKKAAAALAAGGIQ